MAIGAAKLNGDGAAAWPTPAHPTSPTEDQLGGKASRTVHRRKGVIMSITSHGTKKVWELEWRNITTAQVSTLRGWWDTGHFRFYYDYASSYTAVYWNDAKFVPTKKRGDYYDLSATLEEV